MNTDLFFREAGVSDIAAMHIVRMSVHENVLSHPSVVTERDYVDYITERGKGWVCESGGSIIGFCIVDVTENNVWALFVKPEFEGRGVGRHLHALMLKWYFQHASEPLKLTTAPETRAELFYRLNGWKDQGKNKNGEIVFQMRKARISD